jgi:2-(1,2-epoxy-1,2-dihydrophenyl)acetyl-CoA isomerase
MATQHIQAERRDGVLKITLDRPDVLNSFNARMAEELSAALQTAGSEEATRAVLLTGIGRAFCAGQDLAEVMPDGDTAGTDLGESWRASTNPIVRAIRLTEKPFVCAVNGVAAGAGATSPSPATSCSPPRERRSSSPSPRSA